MPTGFTQGLLESQKLEVDVQNEKALAQNRMNVAQAYQKKLTSDTAQLEIMSRIFGGPAQAGQAMTEDSPQYIRQLEVAGNMLMQVNPTAGMAMLGKASSVRRTAVLEKKEALKERADNLTEAGARAEAVTDQESYNMYLEDLKASGKDIPRGLTGDYSRDKTALQYLSRSAIKGKDQVAIAQKNLDVQIKMMDLTRKSDQSAVQADIARGRLENAEQRTADRAEHNRAMELLKDKEIVARQNGKLKPITSDERSQALAVITGREDLQGMPGAVRVADALASRAKSQSKGDPEAYNTLLETELNRMVENGEIKIPKKSLTSPSSWFAKPKYEGGQRAEGKVGEAPEEKTAMSRSGKPMVFRNGQWEYK